MLAGWGRYPRYEGDTATVAAPSEVPRILSQASGLIARGNGRAYGDAAVGQSATLSMLKLDRLKAFDPSTGRLTVEAGVLLADIVGCFLPRGFFPPVVPGTKLVTVGGMIAADVHGKNHHGVGGFGASLEEMKLVLPGGDLISCSPTDNRDLFIATIGGMGLTGVIVEATFRLDRVETGWIVQRTMVAGDLRSTMAALDAADSATYSVAWIDCLGRGGALGRSLVFAGEHATPDQLRGRAASNRWPSARPVRLSVPFDLPGLTLNRTSMRAFNATYFRRGASAGADPVLVPWDNYFFPLDGIGNWNLVYGRHGFLQHQCVVPGPDAANTLSEVLDRLAQSRKVAFMAVLKKLGMGSGLLSFPMPGYTLALDLPVRQNPFPLLEEIDLIISRAGGRLYLAKDSTQAVRTFEAGYPTLPEFRSLRRAIGADGRLASRLSTRLGI